MNLSIGERWEGFVENIVKSGRYGSAGEVVCEGLRLVEEREAKLRALRETIQASIAQGGAHTQEEPEIFLNAQETELKKAGY